MSINSPFIQEYPLPTRQAVPGPIAVAPNGTVWFAETNASSLAKFNPSPPSFTEFPFRSSSNYNLPSSAPKTINSLASDSRGNIWFTFSGANAFGYFNITRQAFVYYNLTALTHRSSNFPYGITMDSAGIAWVAETGSSRIARLNPANDSFTEYLLQYNPPQPNTSPIEIFVDTRHFLWITSYWYSNTEKYPESGSTLTKFDPSTGKIIQDFNLSAAGILTPVGVVVDQNDHAWIGDHAGAWFGEVNTRTGEVKLHRTSLPPLNPHPQNLTDRVFDASITLVNDIILGADGTPWFIEHLGGRVGHYIPSNDSVIEYNIPTLTPITLWLAADRTGGIWFTEEYGNKLGFLDTRTATPVFWTIPSSINAVVAPGASTTFTLNVTNLSLNPIKITAGVENTNSFFGPLTNVTILGGAVSQVAVQMSSSPYLLQGNYAQGRFAALAPVIKVTDGNVNYPITVLVVVSGNPYGSTAFLYGAAALIIGIAVFTGTMLIYKPRIALKANRTRESVRNALEHQESSLRKQQPGTDLRT